MEGQRKAKNLTGERFGRLVVMWRAENVSEPSGATRSAWMCKCDCGQGKTVTQHSLKRGLVKSCGCLARERPPTHGMSRTPVYRQWNAMRTRCRTHKDYAGRGIKVCERWDDFAAFLEDMGKPSPGMTLERIDNDKGYEPGNVRWASRLEQANNRRTNINLTFQGQTMTLAEWGRVLGIPKRTVASRFAKGWPPERILAKPPNKPHEKGKKQ